MEDNQENTKFPCWINTEDFQVKYLYNQFINVISRYISDFKLAEELFQDIQKNYSEKGRHYHTMTHIFRMTKEWSRVRRNLADSDAVFFMIMYHDFIYKPTGKNNEQESADFFKNNVASKLNMTEDFIMSVYMGILVTKHGSGFDGVVEKNKDFQLQETEKNVFCDKVLVDFITGFKYHNFVIKFTKKLNDFVVP